MFETVVITVAEAPAPATEGMQLFPPFPERAVRLRTRQILAVLEQIEIDGEPLTVQGGRDALPGLRKPRRFFWRAPRVSPKVSS